MIRHLLKLVWNRKRANALIVGEIFISFIVIFAVLTGAIMYGTKWNEPLGFSWQNVWDVGMEFGETPGIRESPETHAMVMRMLDEVRAMPEVAAVGAASTPPYSFSTSESVSEIDGRKVTYIFDDVTDGFFDAMQLKLVSGRWFNASDDAAQDQPIVIDTNAARELFQTEDAVGKKFEASEGLFYRVVGVIAPFRKDGEATADMNMLFRRAAGDTRIGSHLLVRLHPGTPAVFEQQLLERLQQLAPALSFRIQTMEQMRRNMARMKLSPLIAGGIIGTFLIAMVTLGLTGVLWQNVTRRTREIGLRRAMGATGGSVHRQVLGEVALLATFALAIGSIVVLQLPIIGAFAYVTPSAFTTGFICALAAIYALTVLCGLYPSWLASRLQPADALRYE
ncbi:MAG TPA: ABC transporter permease [Thermoanaerobaculia bacterium]|nr:ABC transporter permease [Thermoanaerobaculia bacterium]